MKIFCRLPCLGFDDPVAGVPASCPAEDPVNPGPGRPDDDPGYQVPLAVPVEESFITCDLMVLYNNLHTC